MIAEGVDRMKTEAGDVPLLAVGGGSFLIPDQVEGCSEVIRVEHHAVANAVGAAIAQVSGEVDQIFSNLTRDQAVLRGPDRGRKARGSSRGGAAQPEAGRIGGYPAILPARRCTPGSCSHGG